MIDKKTLIKKIKKINNNKKIRALVDIKIKPNQILKAKI
jgi:hypothetical protein